MTLPQTKPPAAFRKQVMTLLGETYSDKTLVLCPTAFVRLLNGDHKGAILLAQILYWSDRTKDPQGWFYKSYAEWHAETGLSEAQVRRIVSGDKRVADPRLTLRDLGVETLLRKVKRTGAPTLHYRVNQEQFLTALHRLIGQGDPQHCEGTFLNNGEDKPSTELAMNTDQSASSLIPTQTNLQEISAEDQPSQNPTRHPDEDFDLGIFQPFENRFGKLPQRLQESLLPELQRLGATKVREVLGRCATRGRSWNYVLRALVNEVGASAVQETPLEAQNSGFTAFESAEAWQPPETPEEPILPRSERLQMRWSTAFTDVGTVQDAWDTAFHQLELQLDSATFNMALRGATLVDYEPENGTFLLVVRNAFALDVLHGRLARMVKRILHDVCGHPIVLQPWLREEWIGQVRSTERTA